MLYKPRTKIRYHNCVWKQFKLDFITLIAAIHDVSRCFHAYIVLNTIYVQLEMRERRVRLAVLMSLLGNSTTLFFLFFSLYRMLNLSFSFSFFSFGLFYTSLAMTSLLLFRTLYFLPILYAPSDLFLLFRPFDFSFRKTRIIPALPIISSLNCCTIDIPCVISFCRNLFSLKNYRFILI